MLPILTIKEYEDSTRVLSYAYIKQLGSYQVKVLLRGFDTEFVYPTDNVNDGVKFLEDNYSLFRNISKKDHPPKTKIDLSFGNSCYTFTKKGFLFLKRGIKYFIEGLVFLLILSVCSEPTYLKFWYYMTNIAFLFALILGIFGVIEEIYYTRNTKGSYSYVVAISETTNEITVISIEDAARELLEEYKSRLAALEEQRNTLLEAESTNSNKETSNKETTNEEKKESK